MQVEDFPEVGLNGYKMLQQSSSIQESTNETDILQEILSVAHVSQELINQPNNHNSNTWSNGNCSLSNDFSFLIGKDAHFNPYNPWEDPNMIRPIEISDTERNYGSEKMVENLRWIGMSDKDLEKV